MINLIVYKSYIYLNFHVKQSRDLISNPDIEANPIALLLAALTDPSDYSLATKLYSFGELLLIINVAY
jgi:hypothetical protein